jgi:hypothetical protein
LTTQFQAETPTSKACQCLQSSHWCTKQCSGLKTSFIKSSLCKHRSSRTATMWNACTRTYKIDFTTQ